MCVYKISFRKKKLLGRNDWMFHYKPDEVYNSTSAYGIAVSLLYRLRIKQAEYRTNLFYEQYGYFLAF